MNKYFLQFSLLSCLLLVCGTPKVQAAGTFSISPASGNYLRSCNQSVDIVEELTSGESNAADIIITYDTTKIEIIDALPTIPGTQILPGNAYESYAGNSVNTLTGEIKLVGYSSSSSLQSSATFATILFRSKPLATNGSFNFTFTGADPYNTLDSNIADSITSFDMLSGVTNATYTFTSGSCTSDTTPPAITFVSPKNLANNVLPSTPVIIKISDTGTGIALTSLRIVINGIEYSSISPELSITGAPSLYTVTVLPSSPFPTNAVSVISVTVSDNAGNTKNSNASINTGYSCPITYVTTPGSCPSVPSPTTAPDRISPKVTVISTNTIDLRKVFPLEINVQDSNGISPESFVLTISNKTFTLASTPDRLTLSGSKNNYTYKINLRPDEMAINAEGKIIGSVKVSDLEGNIRIDQLIFQTIGKSPGTSTGTTSTATIEEKLAKILVFYIAPLIAAIYLSVFGILSTQPTIAHILDDKKRPIHFPLGYFVYSNGARHKLFGNVTGNVHGRYPHEAVKLVIQKYGYASVTLPITPSIKHEPRNVILTRV